MNILTIHNSVKDHEQKKYKIIIKAYREAPALVTTADSFQEIQMIKKRLEDGKRSAFFHASVEVKLRGTEIKGKATQRRLSFDSFTDFEKSKIMDELIIKATEDLESLIKEQKAILDDAFRTIA